MPTLNRPQTQFLTMPKKFRAFVGGFGSGKTWVGASAHCRNAWEQPKVNNGYFAPTYSMIRDIFYPTIEEVAHDWGLSARVHQSNKEVHLFDGGVYRSTIICRSMDKPGDIVGFKIGHAQADEIDLLPMDKATLAWRKIIARLRWQGDGVKNSADITTTPEGFRFAWRTFVKELRDSDVRRGLYGIVHASTYDNEANLAPDYIDSLRASYPPQLIDAYLRGRFVNLVSGAVYANFDRKLNHTSAQIEEGEALHIGMDFNVLNMTSCINVIRNEKPLTLAELTKVRDTPTMAKLLKERYLDKKHAVTIYPDASGGNTSSKNASESDLSILRQAGFSIRVNPANPAVKDRVNAVSALILNDKGERRWLINTDACPILTEAVEQQAYDSNGEPDKSTGHDHPNDASGYFIVNRWPIVKRQVKVEALRM